MEHIKKRILLVFMSFVLFFSSIPVNHKNVKAAEVVVGTEVGLALMELILGVAVSYDLVQKFESVFGEPYKLTFSNKPYDGILMTEEQIKAFDQANQSMDDKMSVLYEGSNVKVQYDGDSQIYESTNYNGEEYFLNPYLVNGMINSNGWIKLEKVNQAFKAMLISSVYMATQSLKQNITQTQIETAKAVKQCFTMVASAIQSAKISVSPVDGLTSNSFLLDQCIQLLKYDNLPTWAKAYADTYQYYYVVENMYVSGGVYYPIYMLFFSNEFRYHNDWGLNGLIIPSGKCIQYKTFNQTYSDITDLYRWGDYAEKYKYTNYPLNPYQMHNPYSIKEFPYTFTNVLTPTYDEAEPTYVGVLEGMVTGGIQVGVGGVIGWTTEQIKEGFGQESTTQNTYENIQEVTLPQSYLDSQEEYQLGVLGWLQRLFSSINSVSNSIVSGLSSSLTGTLEDLLEGEDEEGNAVLIPDVLGNIYGNLTDTSGILIGISDVLTGIKEDVHAQTEANTNTAAQALENEMDLQIPSGGGGLFQLITSLVLILLLLLYLFLRCLQFIVLLFKVPASTAFLPPAMEQGLNWLKTTYLFGHAKPKLTFDAVSSADRIGLNISIWGFMIGTVNILILFYIIKRLRGHIERMK